MTREQNLQRSLRTLAVVLGALALAAIFAAMLVPGGVRLAMYATWLMLPGIVVAIHPRLIFALGWSLIGWFSWLVFTASLREVPMAHATVAPYLIVTLEYIILLGIPVGALIYTFVTRAADARDRVPPLPDARVVTRRRA